MLVDRAAGRRLQLVTFALATVAVGRLEWIGWLVMRAPRAPPVILADPDLLKIVFVNLLVNGAHAMKGRGTIRVSVVTMAESCRIAFADEGRGSRRMSATESSRPSSRRGLEDQVSVCQRPGA